MSGIFGTVELFKGLLLRHSPDTPLGTVIEREMGLRDWRELVEPEAVMADEWDTPRGQAAERR